MHARHLVAVALAMLLASCGNDDDQSQGVGSPEPKALSIVQLGDSVAAGEGLYYGFTYQDQPPFPPIWSPPAKRNPEWDGPYPCCHDAKPAYSDVVARDRDANLHKFACTGASYANGIAAAQFSGEMMCRPAQFGVWQTMMDLNPEYDAAHPDIVLVTLGADDVRFVEIVEYCFLASFVRFRDIDEEVLAADDPHLVIRDAFEQLVDALLTEHLGGDGPERVPEGERLCTATLPGSVIQKFFWDHLQTLVDNYATLVQGIRDRAGSGAIPKIVFTTYHDPLPAPDADISFSACPDAMHLSRGQISYLRTLLDTLSGCISEIAEVTVVDIRDVMDGHQWCTHDPWAYGPSALLFDLRSQAPFHPTEVGQAQIAARVEAALDANAQGTADHAQIMPACPVLPGGGSLHR